MELEVIKEVDVDFYDKKYILLNAKQNDKSSRYLLINCYNNGVFFPIDTNYSVCVRYRKADDFGVFNSCEVTEDGKVLVELTNQMLAAAGVCHAEIVIIENESGFVGNITENIGEIIKSENSAILTTMTLHINVAENSFINTSIESSNEFSKLNELITRAERDYGYVMQSCGISEVNAEISAITAKSYAVGETGKRDGENTDNAKYYCNQSGIYSSLAQEAFNDMSRGFYPIGTIEFAELASKDKSESSIGYIYNIKNSFVTDDAFREGAGISYAAGTNVYLTATQIEGTDPAEYYWDCLASTVALTQENIVGLIEFKNYLGIS